MSELWDWKQPRGSSEALGEIPARNRTCLSAVRHITTCSAQKQKLMHSPIGWSGVFVLSLATGSSEAQDVWSSYFGDVNAQVAAACEQIRATPQLQGGYNAVGFSQGGQFLRAVVQRCQHTGPKASVLITMGSQHQGVMNVPGCEWVTRSAECSLHRSQYTSLPQTRPNLSELSTMTCRQRRLASVDTAPNPT